MHEYIQIIKKENKSIYNDYNIHIYFIILQNESNFFPQFWIFIEENKNIKNQFIYFGCLPSTN